MNEERYFLLALFGDPVLIVVRDYDSNFPGVFRQIWGDLRDAPPEEATPRNLVGFLRSAGYCVDQLSYRVVRDGKTPAGDLS